MQDVPPFRDWLKQRRVALDMSRVELAQQAGCSLATIRQLEQGRRRPSRQLAERLARYLFIAAEERSAFLQAARAPIQPRERDSAAPDAQAPAPVQQPATLAAAPGPLIGREREIAAASALLMQTETKLLTLAGPGGVGKTRLGVQLATEQRAAFADGAYFVELAPLSDPELLLAAIEQALHLPQPGANSSPARLITALRERQLLLFLDNFEHLLAGAPLLAELVASCPHIKLVVTSRSPLRLQPEHLFVVPPLALPDLQSLPAGGQALISALQDNPAVRLFMARAKMVRPALTLTAENAVVAANICRQLDGLPLAIELAAARLRGLPAQALLSRLDHRLALLTDGASDLPERQQTMRRLIDWSYNLLDSDEQVVFRRLGVFAANWTLDAAEAVCCLSNDRPYAVTRTLLSLLDKSLIQEQHREDGEAGFAMLEVIREYARERLQEHGELMTLHRRHAEYYLALAEQAGPQLTGPEQGRWLDRLRWDNNNLRAALEHLINSMETELALRLMCAIWKFWQFRQHWAEGLRWMQRVLALPGGQQPSAARAGVLCGAGWLAHEQADETLASTMFEESLAVAREIQDPRAIALALHGVGTQAQNRHAFDKAISCYLESLRLFRALDDHEQIAWSLRHVGLLHQVRGSYAEANAFYEESLALFRSIGHRWGLVRQLTILAHALLEQGDYHYAGDLLREGLALGTAHGYQQALVEILRHLGRAAYDEGRYAEAREQYQQSLSLARELQDESGVFWGLAHLGCTLLAQGELAEARALFTEAASSAADHRAEWELIWLQSRIARADLEDGQLEQARRRYLQALRYFQHSNLAWGMPGCLEGLAAIYTVQPHPDQHIYAAQLLYAADILRRRLNSSRPVPEQVPYSRALARLREQFEVSVLDAIRSETEARPLEHIIAEAVA